MQLFTKFLIYPAIIFSFSVSNIFSQSKTPVEKAKQNPPVSEKKKLISDLLTK